MRVVILADRLGKTLWPLTDNTSVALLPVAGKAVIEHTLDLLAGAGMKEALIAVSAHADQIRTLVGDGRRWGLDLDIVLTRGEEHPGTLLGRLPQSSASNHLLIRGDMLRGAGLATFLEQRDRVQGPVVHALLGGQPAGYAWLRKQGADLCSVCWPLPALGQLDTAARLDIPEGNVYPLDSLADFHRANLDAAAGDIEGLLLPGRETALGLHQGRNTRISPRSLRLGRAFVGSGSRIDPTAELYGTVVVSDNAIVDRMARLTNTVVLPHTYVGELVDLREAIVRGNDLIRVDTGATVHVADAFLLANLRESTLGFALATPLHRLAGALLLLLSLPLWPIAALVALREQPEAPLERVKLRGNKVGPGEFGQPERSEFTVFEWATRVPVLRFLPWILAVISGDLRLVGVEPITAEQAELRMAEWERLADSAPAGLIGPTQLRFGADAPEEERLMSDAFYAAHRTPGANLRLLLEAFLALFSRRAWRSGV